MCCGYTIAVLLSSSVLLRYPIVERAVSDLPTLQDPAFTSGLRESLSRVLQESRSRDAAEGTRLGPSRELHRCSPVLMVRADDDVDMAPDATGRPNLTPLQTRPLGQDGSGTPGDQDGLKTRSVHFDAQEDNDSDSDSAMLESPISDRDTSEPAAQFSQDSIQGSHDSMPPSSPMVQLTDEPALQPPESPAMQASEELYIQDTLEPMVEDAAQPMVQADDEVAEAQASEEVVVQTNEETSMPPPAPPEHDGILAS